MVPDPPAGAQELVDQPTKTFVQEVTGVLLFYSRAVDPTMLIAVNKISSDQSKPTKATLDAVDRLLSYAERYPNATIVLRPCAPPWLKLNMPLSSSWAAKPPTRATS